MKFIKWVFYVVTMLVISQQSYAYRLGNGRSYTTNSYRSNNSYYSGNYSNSNYSNNTTSRSGGMGPGSAALLGAAAGAAGGYMLGRSSYGSGAPATTNASATTTSGAPVSSANIPWGIIVVLGILLLIGLMLFRKSKAGDTAIFSIKQPFNTNNPTPSPAQNNPMATPSNNALMDKMPDGVEKLYFLRQVKGMFLHIQSMNNQDNCTEIAKYMTQDLYNQLLPSIMANNCIADFENLDCALVSCDLDESTNALNAVVRFTGLVSDDPKVASTKFSEIWTFIKTDPSIGSKWLVASITQDTASA